MSEASLEDLAGTKTKKLPAKVKPKKPVKQATDVQSTAAQDNVDELFRNAGLDPPRSAVSYQSYAARIKALWQEDEDKMVWAYRFYFDVIQKRSCHG